MGDENGMDDAIVSGDFSVATNDSNDSYRIVKDEEEAAFDSEVKDMAMMIGSDVVANTSLM